jgi:hypothetical protein
LAVFFCLLVIFLAGRLVFTKQPPANRLPDAPAPRTPVEVAKRVPKGDAVPRGVPDDDKPSEKATQPQAKAEQPATVAIPDPDEEFMKRIASLPLDRATLEARLEVGRRIKASEKKRAKPIYSEEKDGKSIIAYAVKQASMAEIAAMTKPYKLLLDQQASSDARHYVDQRYQNLFNSYGLTDGRYRLLYAVIPASASSPVLQYSYAAASEQECMDILRQELAPRPPVVIGVTYSSRQGQSSSSYGIVPGDWRMDQLVSEELLKPYYQSSHRAGK